MGHHMTLTFPLLLWKHSNYFTRLLPAPQNLLCLHKHPHYSHVHTENSISPSSFSILCVMVTVKTSSCMLSLQKPGSTSPWQDRQPLSLLQSEASYKQEGILPPKKIPFPPQAFFPWRLLTMLVLFQSVGELVSPTTICKLITFTWSLITCYCHSGGTQATFPSC